MRRKVILHGGLKDLYPDEIYLDAVTLGELINGLNRQTKIFQPVGGKRHSITALGLDTPEQILSPMPADMHEVHLMPSLFGGKGFFQILLGAVLVATAIILAPATGGGSLSSVLLHGTAMTFSASLFLMGTIMVLGGLLQIVSPSPKTDNPTDPLTRYLGAPGNTVKIGTRIPLLYGTNKVYGHYISFDVAVQQETNPVVDNPLGAWSQFLYLP